MKIAFGCDHGGVDLKLEVLNHLSQRGIEVIDLGVEPGEKANYPVSGLAVAKAVVNGEADLGILVCGTGVGISIAANKVPGIRAVVCSEPYTAKLSRQHNNSNILAFGARVVGSEMAKMIIDNWLDASFEGGRHQTRVDMITQIEQKQKID